MLIVAWGHRRHWKGDFKLWGWRRLLRAPWTAGRSDQSTLKETSPKFIGRTDSEAEASVLWPPDVKNWLIGKDPDAGKDWGQEEKGATEDEMVGWHHWVDGREFEQTLGDSERQGRLECCSPWGCKEPGETEQLNDNDAVVYKARYANRSWGKREHFKQFFMQMQPLPALFLTILVPAREAEHTSCLFLPAHSSWLWSSENVN